MNRSISPLLAAPFLSLLWVGAAAAQQGQSPANTTPTTPDTSVPAQVAPPATPPVQSGIQQGTKDEAAHMGTLTAPDAEFVRKAALGGMAEVAAGKLAERSQNAQVKDFARQMVEAHEKVGRQLATLAQSKGDTMPTKLDVKDEQQIDELSHKSGRDFDRAYMQLQVEAHQQTIAMFQQVAKTATDPDLKQFAQETIPTFQHHLEMAQQVEQQVASK